MNGAKCINRNQFRVLLSVPPSSGLGLSFVTGWHCVCVATVAIIRYVASESGGSRILAFIQVLLLQGWYILKIPSKLKHDSKKKEESRKTTVRKKEKIGERKRSKKQIGEY